jgi:hypothetical protein
VLGAFSLLLLVELTYRAFADPGPPDRFLTIADDGFDWREAAPYVVFRAKPGSEVHIEDELWVRLHAETGRDPGPAHVVIDRHGFRYDGDLGEPKRPGELRIFLLGGSVTLLGMRQETTLCGVLERKVRERRRGGARVRCASAGIMSGISDQELAMLVHQVASLEPDIVVVYDGYNDRVARLVFEPTVGEPVGWRVRALAQRRGLAEARWLREAVEALPTWRLALSRSRLATRLRPALRLENQLATRLGEAPLGGAESKAGGPRPSVAVIALHLLENWRKMHAVARGLDFDLVTILQPARPDERQGEHLREYYEILNAEIAEQHAQGAPWYSFDRLLDDDPEIFYDPVHTFDEGHERIAARMLEVLIELGAVPAPPELH